MTRSARFPGFCRPAVICLVTVALAAAAVTAMAEESGAPTGVPVIAPPERVTAPPPAAAPSLPPQPPVANKPGFLHQLKVWWDQSVAFVDTRVKDTRGRFDDLNQKSNAAVVATQGAVKGALDVSKDAAAVTQGAMKGALNVSKGAATTLMRLPNTRVVEVHERCQQAANGAPDCAATAAAACRGKGFAAGTPLNVVTAEKCDTRQAVQAVQQGQLPGKGDCPVESMITRAVCQ